jgi:hypothetical protein
MLNSDPISNDAGATQDEAVQAIVRSGAVGAVLVAGLATAVVAGIWFAFYFLVFMPRAGAP